MIFTQNKSKLNSIMSHFFDLIIPINQEVDLGAPIELAKKRFKKNADKIIESKLVRRSLDARKKIIKVNLRFEVFFEGEKVVHEIPFSKKNISNAKAIHIIGAGPAGLFAALQAIHIGLKPILYERGKDVRARRRDLAKINREQIVNPDSNYCFGEGGAGTYSDGKLYTRSKKRGDVERVLNGLVQYGASDNILVEAHPHIGTNKLPQIIIAIRESILECGGEVNFNQKLTDISIKENRIESIELNGETKVKIDHLILATGHSAHDIFELLDRKKVKLNAKPFALGLRVEHPQSLINKIQYHDNENNDLLPPAAYKIVKQVDGKGVYSFCMCPGGIIAPCATNPGEIVTNGWSPSKRNNPFANSGIVVSIEEKDWEAYLKYGALAALRFQGDVEKKAYNAVNELDGQAAPAQRLIDFIDGKESKDLPKCSYQPGIVPARLDKILPSFVSKRLQKAFLLFGQSMKGYLTNEAVVVGVESRTSSPVNIPRDRESMSHVEIKNLYPCGEGSGYAGGIVSAAIDGIKATDAILKKIGG